VGCIADTVPWTFRVLPRPTIGEVAVTLRSVRLPRLVRPCSLPLLANRRATMSPSGETASSNASARAPATTPARTPGRPESAARAATKSAIATQAPHRPRLRE
jgi:hypothetical protein